MQQYFDLILINFKNGKLEENISLVLFQKTELCGFEDWEEEYLILY